MRLAFRPSPDDPRDKPFALLRDTLASRVRGATVVPGEVVALPQTTPISNQGSLGSCVANAVCDAVELLSAEPVQLSRLGLYWFARFEDGSECEDGGTFVRSAFKVLSKLGVCRESVWPYNERAAFLRPPIIALQDAYDHRITGYFRISTRGHARGEDVRAAIDGGHPVVFGVDVGQGFLDYDGDESKVWRYPDRSVGGHAMVIVGYRKNSDGSFDYLVRNSWGTWGLRSRPGHCWFSERYLWECSDLWTATTPWSA